MEALAGPFQATLVLLGLGGVAKIVAPRAFTDAVRSLGLRLPPMAGRATGVVEIALAAAAFWFGSWPFALAVGLLYLAFTAVVIAAMRRGLPDCGCFGARSAPPSPIHVGVNLVAAGVALAAVAFPPGRLPDVLDGQLGAGVPYLAAVALAGWFLMVLDTSAAEVLSLASQRQQTVRSAEGAG